MKKTYITPAIRFLAYESEWLLTSVSGVYSSDDDFDISYGGCDDEGTLTPGARHSVDIWEEED